MMADLAYIWRNLQGCELGKCCDFACAGDLVLPLGNVRALIITQKQFHNMQILLGSAGFNERVNDDKNLVLFEFDEKIGDYRYLSEDLKDLTKSMGESFESGCPI